MKKTALIIGAGEVGKSLFRAIQDHHDVHIRDITPTALGMVDVLNICFPYQQGFEIAVQEYQKEYSPSITIIHSTVPVGTSRKLKAVHSPIHGKHPNLKKGIQTFVKYIGAADPLDADLADEFLREAKINTMIVSSPEVSELSKILCTTYYGWNILFNKEVKKICDDHGLPFDEVYGWTQFYNEGYKKLGMPHFIRPMLEYQEGKIGGHCVINNTQLLDSWLTNTLREKDESY